MPRKSAMARLKHVLGCLNDRNNLNPANSQAAAISTRKRKRALEVFKGVMTKGISKLVRKFSNGDSHAPNSGTIEIDKENSSSSASSVANQFCLETSSFGDSLSSSLSKYLIHSDPSVSAPGTRDISFSSAVLPSLVATEHRRSSSGHLDLATDVMYYSRRSCCPSAHFFGSQTQDGSEAILGESSGYWFAQKSVPPTTQPNTAYLQSETSWRSCSSSPEACSIISRPRSGYALTVQSLSSSKQAASISIANLNSDDALEHFARKPATPVPFSKKAELPHTLEGGEAPDEPDDSMVVHHPDSLSSMPQEQQLVSETSDTEETGVVEMTYTPLPATPVIGAQEACLVLGSKKDDHPSTTFENTTRANTICPRFASKADFDRQCRSPSTFSDRNTHSPSKHGRLSIETSSTDIINRAASTGIIGRVNAEIGRIAFLQRNIGNPNVSALSTAYLHPGLDKLMTSTPPALLIPQLDRLSSSPAESSPPSKSLDDARSPICRQSFETVMQQAASAGSWHTVHSDDFSNIERNRRYVKVDRYWVSKNIEREAYVRISSIAFDINKASPPCTPILNESDDGIGLDETIRFSPSLNSGRERGSKVEIYHREKKALTAKVHSGIRKYGPHNPDLTPFDEVKAEMLLYHQHHASGGKLWTPGNANAGPNVSETNRSPIASLGQIDFHRNLTLAALDGRLSPNIRIHSPNTTSNGIIRHFIAHPCAPHDFSPPNLECPRPIEHRNSRAFIQRALWNWEATLNCTLIPQDQEEDFLGLPRDEFQLRKTYSPDRLEQRRQQWEWEASEEGVAARAAYEREEHERRQAYGYSRRAVYVPSRDGEVENSYLAALKLIPRIEDQVEAPASYMGRGKRPVHKSASEQAEWEASFVRIKGLLMQEKKKTPQVQVEQNKFDGDQPGPLWGFPNSLSMAVKGTSPVIGESTSPGSILRQTFARSRLTLHDEILGAIGDGDDFPDFSGVRMEDLPGGRDEE